MTDATERRLAGILVQINEMLDSRLPEHLPQKRPDWQVYTFLAGIIFMSGALWYQVIGNTASLHEMMRQNEAAHKAMRGDIEDNKHGLVAHMQWELEHELEQKDNIISRLKGVNP